MLNRYHLFFGDLSKICEQIGEKNNAILYEECNTISKEICRNANDVVATGSIQNFPHSHPQIDELGVLIKRGLVQRKVAAFGSPIFNRKNYTRNSSSHLFFFKKCLLVCSHKKTGKEFEGKEKNIYVATFWVNRMKIQEVKGNGFILVDSENGPNMSFEAISMEEKSEWVFMISKEIERNHTHIRRDKKFSKLMGRKKSMTL